MIEKNPVVEDEDELLEVFVDENAEFNEDFSWFVNIEEINYIDNEDILECNEQFVKKLPSSKQIKFESGRC